jgi:hypothetical protein
VWFAVENLDSDITEGAELNDVSDDGLEGLAGRLEVSDQFRARHVLSAIELQVVNDSHDGPFGLGFD